MSQLSNASTRSFPKTIEMEHATTSEPSLPCSLACLLACGLGLACWLGVHCCVLFCCAVFCLALRWLSCVLVVRCVDCRGLVCFVGRVCIALCAFVSPLALRACLLACRLLLRCFRCRCGLQCCHGRIALNVALSCITPMHMMSDTRATLDFTTICITNCRIRKLHMEEYMWNCMHEHEAWKRDARHVYHRHSH